jgi:hypothetical protein
MKLKTIAFVLLVGLLVLVATPVYAQEVPPLPQAFYGTIEVNGSPAPAGTAVEVRGEGVEVGVGNNPIVTTTEGRYGSEEPLEPKLVVQGEIAEGTILTFYVDGVATAQTTEWHSGEVTKLDLVVTLEESPPPETTETPAPSPAAFSLGSLAVSPNEIAPGGTVTISVSVANTGGETGTYIVTLKIDDVVEASKEVSIDAGASQEVTFTTVRDVAKTYSVDVNGLSGTFVVKEETPAPPPAPPASPAPTAPPAAPTPPAAAPPTEPAKAINWPVLWGVIGVAIAVGVATFVQSRRKAGRRVY